MTTNRILQKLTVGLDRTLITPSGFFRVVYGLRNPPLGRGLGRDGVEDVELVQRYADALEKVRHLFETRGWPRPRTGQLVAYVFHTERLGYGDCPLSITGEVSLGVYETRLALRSRFDEPRPRLRLERAEVEAAHEASHAFTHQFVPPLAPHAALWSWFDEATAVLTEGEVFPDHPESRRFGAYWSWCPEDSLMAWEDGYGHYGYFAAWFLRYLVGRFGPSFLLDVWRAGSKTLVGPLTALDAWLQNRGEELDEVFWDYCREAYAPTPRLAPGLVESYGPRSITESFDAKDGQGQHDPLLPLGCRYYRLNWEGNIQDTPVVVSLDGDADPGDVRSALLTVGPDGQVLDHSELTAAPSRSCVGVARRPPEGGHTAIVVGRVRTPRDERLSTASPAQARILVGRSAEPRVADGPEFGSPSEGVSARQTAFLGPRFAVARPRELDPDEPSVSGRPGPEFSRTSSGRSPRQ